MRISLVAISLFFASCDNDEANDIFRDDEENPTPTENTIVVNPTNAGTAERVLEVEAQPGTSVPVKVKFTGDKNMYRLYMTKNILGEEEGAVPFEYPDLGAKKADGSIDLPRQDKQEFTYNFDFPAPANENQIVQYVLWVTNARGDYRDIANDNAIADDAYGVITIKGNANANAEAIDYKEFSAILLAAPLKDGSSKTFISLFNKEVYAINQGEEYAALWDFGYYYGKTGKASFASAANYPSNIVDVKTIGGTTDLNNFYFKKSDKDAAFFSSIVSGDDLEFITKPATERVNNLASGTIVEFVDAYGNKGLIKVNEIKGTDGNTGSIKFDVKVQVKATPIKG